MTAESMNAFVIHAKEQGASENMIRGFSGAVKTLYAFLPEDKMAQGKDDKPKSTKQSRRNAVRVRLPLD